MITLMTRDEWIERGRDVVLDALDEFVRETLHNGEARGWTDPELPELFKALDIQLDFIAKRINDGEEPGSDSFQITDPEAA